MKNQFVTQAKVVWSCLLTVALVAIAAVTAATALDTSEEAFEPRLERACYREVMQRSPGSVQKLETVKHGLEGTIVAVASGKLETERLPGYWAPLEWSCRIDIETADIIRVEFKRPVSSPRFSALSRM